VFFFHNANFSQGQDVIKQLHFFALGGTGVILHKETAA